MRITSVEVVPDGPTPLTELSFRDPRAINPFNIRDMIGLDADEIVSRYYGKNGNSLYYNLSLEQRTVIMKVGLNPRFNLAETNSSLRDHLYRSISSSRTGRITLNLKDGGTIVAAIAGFVTKMETPHFERDPVVQITIKCDDSMLRAPTPVNFAPLAQLTTNATMTDNLSTAPHGFTFKMLFLSGSFSQFWISDPNNPGWEFRIIPSSNLVTGDVLNFSSEENNRYLFVQRGLFKIQLANGVTKNSIWPIIFPGVNTFTISTAGSTQWTELRHRPTYWGV